MRSIYANICVKQTKINFEQNNSDKNCIETHDQLTREKYRFSIASYVCSRYIQPDCQIRVCSSDSEGERERVRQEKMMTLDSACNTRIVEIHRASLLFRHLFAPVASPPETRDTDSN